MMVSDRTELIFFLKVQFSSVVVNWGDLGKIWRHFFFVMIEGMGADISWVETRDDAKYHTMRRTALVPNQK